MNAALLLVGLKPLRAGWKARPTQLLFASLIVLLLLGASTVAGRAQQFAIDWYKISAGAGVSSSAQFTVAGAIGQHDSADTLAGGNFTITGGFWSLIAAVQTSGAPLLNVTLAGPNTVLISWPAPSTGFVLQQSSSLVSGSWVDATNAVSTTPESNQVLVPFSGGNRFYRLIFR